MKLTRLNCAECGGEIIMTHTRPNTTFRINDDGHIVHYDNSLEGCELNFHCSNDMEHIIAPPEDTKLYKIWEKWRDLVEDEFYNKHMEEIY